MKAKTYGKYGKYFVFLLGTGILAFGLYNVHARSLISEGGVLGLSLLLWHWFGLSPGIGCFVLDSSCFLLGTAVLGRRFFRDSLFCSASYALWYLLLERVGPLLPSLLDYPLAAALVGGVFVGLGVGLVVRFDCAAGGDDALALVFHKKTGLRVSLFYNLSDFTVLLLSLSYIPLRQIVWSLLSVLVSSGIIELLRPRNKETEEPTKA